MTQEAGSTQAPRGTKALLDLARHLERARNEVVHGSEGTNQSWPTSDDATFDRWQTIFARELDGIAAVVRRLKSTPAAVSGKEVSEALTWARELERLLFASHLQTYRGQWVAVRGNKILASSLDRAELVNELRDSGRHLDLIFQVGQDEKIEV